MRKGLFLGDLLFGPLEAALAGIKAAEAEGFDSVWFPQVTGPDTLTMLAMSGAQTNRIELGTAVVPTYPRHPMMLAGQALTVQAATGGRLALGIGLSHKVVIEDMLGYSFDRPARHMREYLAALTPLLRGEPAKVEGETLKAVGGLSGPSGQVAPPVLLAALAPAMLRLAGSVAAGTITWMVGPTTLAEHIIPTMAAAADKAGHGEAPRVVAAFPVCVTDDVAAARQRAAKTFAMYGSLPSYRAMIDREGMTGPEDMAIVGNEDAVSAEIARLAGLGVHDFVASCFGTPDDKARTRALLLR